MIVFLFQAGECNEDSLASSLASTSACVDPCLPADPEMVSLEEDGEPLSAIRLKTENSSVVHYAENMLILPKLPQLD